MYHSHPSATATASSFDDHRVSNFSSNCNDLLRIIGQCPLTPGNNRDPRSDHRVLRAYLVPHESNRFWFWPDKDKPTLFDSLGEVSIFRQKTVTRMYRLCVCNLSGTDNRRNIKIGRSAGRGPNADRFVSKTNVLRICVSFGMNRNRFDAHLAARSLNPKSNLAAIRNQYLFKHSEPTCIF